MQALVVEKYLRSSGTEDFTEENHKGQIATKRLDIPMSPGMFLCATHSFFSFNSPVYTYKQICGRNLTVAICN